MDRNLKEGCTQPLRVDDPSPSHPGALLDSARLSKNVNLLPAFPPYFTKRTVYYALEGHSMRTSIWDFIKFK